VQAIQLDRPMTFEAFLLFCEDKEGRWELIDGRPTMRPPPTDFHQIISDSIARLLYAARKETKASWIALSGHGVPIPGRPDGFVPDVMVKPAATGSSFSPDPIVAFGIVSPSNTPKDRASRLASYSRVPTMRHYVVVHQDEPLVEVYGPDWGAPAAVVRRGLVHLPEIGVSLPLTAIYEDTPHGR